MSSKQHSIRAVNFLYLVVLGLMVFNILLGWLPQFLRLALNQIFFIALPAYLFLRFFERDRTKSLADRVRWRWPGLRVGLLAFLTGAGLYPLSIYLGQIFTQVLGYQQTGNTDSMLPTSVSTALMAVLAYAVLAPICEEFLFRGVMQTVYERRGVLFAIGVVGFLFITFHLSLIQGLTIILITLALGYVFHRSRSLPASMLTHFGANGMAALVITGGVFQTGASEWLLSPMVTVIGLAVSTLALVGLTVQTRGMQSAMAEAPVQPETELKQPRRRWLVVYWPVLVGLSIWLPLVSAELVLARSPELLQRLMQQTSGPDRTIPDGYELVFERQFQERGVEDEALYEFTLDAPRTVRFYITFEEFNESPLVVRLVGPGGYEMDYLRMNLDGRMGYATVHPLAAEVQQGTYQLRATAQREDRSIMRGYMKIGQ
jgi:membrane protease YdiL (CAAX protease family)